MSTIITRVWYCPNCFRRLQPKGYQRFLTHGSTRDTFIVKRSIRSGVPGFTPHLLMLQGCENEVVTYKYACAMEKCGVHLMSQENGVMEFNIDWAIAYISQKEWNNWVTYHDPFYKI